MKPQIPFEAACLAKNRAAHWLLLSCFWLYAGWTLAETGVPLWTNRYNGPVNANDQAFAVAVDGSGNVFVTGSSRGSSSYDYATVAYSGAGMPLWTNRYDGLGKHDYAAAIAVDGNGNVFVTGSSEDDFNFIFGDPGDYVTMAYSGAGVPLWTNHYNGPGNSADSASAVAVDGGGNVFVTGYSYDSGGVSAAYATIKYSGMGVPLWTNRYNGPGYYGDRANAIAVDGSDNVFVTGSSFDSYTSSGYATIKYSGAGVALWTNRYDAGDYGSANAVAVDKSGNVFVTGYSANDFVTIKYSSAGEPLWTNRYDGPGISDDQAQAVAVDGNGNVIVAGYTADEITTSDFLVIKYSGSGVPVWTNRYNGPGNYEDRAKAVAVDSSGSVFVTGQSAGSASSYDYATIKYSSAGVPLWTNRYNGPANRDDLPGGKQSLALGPDGSVYVTGSTDGDSGGNTYHDFATIKYISVPVLTLKPDGSGGFFLSVNGVSNVTYRLQRAPTVAGPWSDLATNTAPAAGLIEFHDTNPLPSQAFYRTIEP